MPCPSAWRSPARPWAAGCGRWGSPDPGAPMADQGERIGPYQVLERIGAGGMGEVFLAWDERLDRRVALKRIRSGLDASPERRERFRREARIAARLNHP